jgi:transposase-like protein
MPDQSEALMGRRKFTPSVLEQIPKLVSDGKSASEIAGQIGCSVDSLRVRCSQLGVTLRRNGLTVRLSQSTLDGLRRQARAEDMSETAFASALLEAIARDDLYKAVLDLD